jgi:large subunit ribosomal protein L15
MRSRLRGESKGKHGFVSHTAQQVEFVNVDELDRLEIDEIDLPEKKVLGRGRLDRKLVVRASSFSDTAKSKIEAAGGEAVII